jgi:hypothetical protein
MFKLASSKKYVIIVFLTIVIAVIAYTVFRQINPRVGFKYFEPAYLPPSTSIKEKRISITNSNISVEQNFRTEDWVYSIIEDKDDGSSSIGTANQDYDAKSVKPTCSIQNSPEKMKYRVCHWIDYGHINIHEVIFIKNCTYIYSLIPTTIDQEISSQEIENYVDSFVQKSTTGLPVLRSIGP